MQGRSSRGRTGRSSAVAALSVAAFIGTALAPCGPAMSAEIIRVGCEPGPGPIDQLIAAIETANQTPSLETVIYLARKCTYLLDHAAEGANGLPIVRGKVTIRGRRAFLGRDADGPPFRILTVASGGQLKLTSLSIYDGFLRTGRAGEDATDAAAGDGADGRDGGGILNHGWLKLDHVVVSYNVAGDGGDGGAATGTDAPAGSAGANGADAIAVVAGNGGAGGSGGGIFSDGTLIIHNSVIARNAAGDGGRGGAATGGRGGDGGSGLPTGGKGGRGGDAMAGGGGYGGHGGGIFSSGILSIHDSSVDDNRAGDAGQSGIAIGGRGGDGGSETGSGGDGGDASTGSKTGGAGGEGGGIAVSGGIATIISTGLFGNFAGSSSWGHATGGGGGDGGCGGAGGTAGGSMGYGHHAGKEGGIALAPGATLTIRNVMEDESTPGLEYEVDVDSGEDGESGAACPTVRSQ